MIDNPIDENFTNTEDPLPENYRLLIQNKVFRELIDGDEKEMEEKEKCR